MSVDLVRSLTQQLTAEQALTGTLDRYYSGSQPLAFLHPSVRAATAGRLTNMVINWPRIIVGAVEERLNIEGFRIAGDDQPIPELWRVWQANGLDRASGLAHLDALIHGRSYAIVWAGRDERTPRITVETSREMTVTYDPMTGELSSALKAFDLDATGQPTRATLYLPDRVERYRLEAGGWALLPTEGVVTHDLGEVPVVALVNQPRLGLPGGESELSDVIPLTDAIAKLATDMMVSAEYHAMPRRWITGMQLAPAATPEGERERELLKQYLTNAEAGRYNALPAGTATGQYPEAALDNFVGAIRMFTEHLAAIGKLPPHALGINTANPASADAIRSAESSLVKKVERKQRGFGESWEHVMRLAQRVVEDVQDPALDSLETIWADAATPTVAQQADAAVKLLTGERPIITVRQAREDLGYTPVQIARMEQDDARAALGPVSAQLAEAQRLQREQGLSQQAAFAAVGLLQAASAIAQQP